MNHDDTNRKKPGFLGCKCFDCIFTTKNVIDVTKSAGLSSSSTKLDMMSDEKKLISEEKNEKKPKIYDHHVAVVKDSNDKLKKDNFLSPPNSIIESSIDSHNNLIIKRQRSKSEISISNRIYFSSCWNINCYIIFIFSI